MYTVEDQLAALTNAGRHLKDGGVLAFDVFNPRFDKLLSGDGEEHLELEWPAWRRDRSDHPEILRQGRIRSGQYGIRRPVYLQAV